MLSHRETEIYTAIHTAHTIPQSLYTELKPGQDPVHTQRRYEGLPTKHCDK